MSLSKSKCWYSINHLHFLNRFGPLSKFWILNAKMNWRWRGLCFIFYNKKSFLLEFLVDCLICYKCSKCIKCSIDSKCPFWNRNNIIGTESKFLKVIKTDVIRRKVVKVKIVKTSDVITKAVTKNNKCC